VADGPSGDQPADLLDECTAEHWVTPRPFLGGIGWLMPGEVFVPGPLPLVAERSDLGRPAWLRARLAVRNCGACVSVEEGTCLRSWVDRTEVMVR
jgi:hypothetical protein